MNNAIIKIKQLICDLFGCNCGCSTSGFYSYDWASYVQYKECHRCKTRYFRRYLIDESNYTPWEKVDV